MNDGSSTLNAAIGKGSMRSAPLARRYTTVGVPALYLNDVRVRARDRIASKIEAGIYHTVCTACPVCGCDAGIVVSYTEMYGLPYEVAICAGCDLVYTRRHINSTSLGRFYNDEYRPLDRGCEIPQADFFELEYNKGERTYRFLQETSIELPTGSLIVEIGCGAGGVLAWFRDRGYRAVGFDVGQEYVQFGRHRDGLDLHTGDLAAALAWLGQEVLTPRLVIYEQVLEHIADPVRELTLLRGGLSAESVVFIGVPGLRNIDDHYDSDFLRYLQFPHLIHFELASLSRIAATSGFSLVSGNELIQAAFRPVESRNADRTGSPLTDAGSRESVVSHLQNLERRWKAKQRRNYVRQYPQRIRRRVGRAVRAVRALLQTRNGTDIFTR
jgi:SAM-dependent methyltransferase